MSEDRRVRKTKKALRDGLVELLNEKSLQSVTVRELTERADVHRSTFYANFKDVYDLYTHTEDTILQEIREIVAVDCVNKPHVFFNILLGYVSENREVTRLFFGGNINGAFYERLTTMFKSACVNAWCKEYGISGTAEMDYYVQFCLSGGLGVIGMWVARDFDYPIEELVDMLAEIESGVGKLLSINLRSTVSK
ncbi:MAG: TetR/AcrR family transcriptional regulator [Defluviitaleaceae bacterium]|nr:TetR/AcrR family transcriptional regulator [Defluviitaleaceae bacterium]